MVKVVVSVRVHNTIIMILSFTKGSNLKNMVILS